MTRRRSVPPLAVASWVIAVVGIAGLAVAVARHWSSHAGMTGHHYGSAESLYRAGGDPSGPLLSSSFFTSWQLDAVAVAVLVLAAAAYLTGVALLSVRHPGEKWPLARTVSFLTGLVVCGFATNGSIAVYDQVLFTGHMVGHLALVMLAPVLLVWGRPLRLAIRASEPKRAQRIERVAQGRVVSLLTSPPVALATYTAVIVGSHLTGVMDSVMRTTWAGQVEHLVYVLAGCQFFVLIVGEEPIRWRLAAPARWLLLAVAMAVDTFTGVVLLQTTKAIDMVTSPNVHVDALSDTHTGGAIMWFGGDGIMAAVMVVLVVGWLRAADSPTPDEPGWLEQARRAAFTENTGDVAAAIDDDDAARRSYNEWLANLDQRR